MKIIIRNEADKQTFINLVTDRKIIDGKKYTGTFNQIRLKRTLGQNALFHLWCRCLANELEGDADQAGWYKDYYKRIVLSEIAEPEVKIIRGKRLERYSIKKLSTLQLSKLISFVKRDAFDQFGILLLTLEDKNFNEFYETYKG